MLQGRELKLPPKRPRASSLLPCAGKREWPAFRDWFASNLAPALTAWMGDVEVVYEGEKKLDPGSKYVFGYAPHGLFPIGMHHHIFVLWHLLAGCIYLCCSMSCATDWLDEV